MFKSVEGQVVLDSTTNQAWVILDAGGTIWNNTLKSMEPGVKLALGVAGSDYEDLWQKFQWGQLRDGNGNPFPVFASGQGVKQQVNTAGNNFSYVYRQFSTEQLNTLTSAKGYISRQGPNDIRILVPEQNSNEEGGGTDLTPVEDGYTAIPNVNIPTRFGYSPMYGRSDLEKRASMLAQEIIKRGAEEKNRIKQFGSIFTKFSKADDIIDNQQTIISNGLFSANSPSLSTMFTSSLQTTSNKQYYYEAWDLNPAISVSADAQFSVAYGHRLGSGSSAQGTLNDSPTRAIYSQYRLLLLEPGDNKFTFKDGTSSDSIYVINFNRDKLKERLDPGNWQLTLAQLSGSTVPNNSHTGSNVKIQTSNPSFISLIDDSNDYYNVNEQGIAGTIYSVVSGSLANGIHNPSAPHYYGLVYPNTGTIVLNDNVLNKSCSFNSVTGSNTAGDNARKLLTSISGAFSANSSTNAMYARNVETVSSTHYFIRVKYKYFNFSNNPTYVTGSEGLISNPTFLNDPTVYITTIGLYNDSQELLAVGKLSQPIKKSYDIETLIKVKLDL